MDPIRKFNYSNYPKTLPQKGLGDLLTQYSGGVTSGMNIAGGAVDALNTNDSTGLGALSGALKGASAGMALGPWGALAGGVLGGVTSVFAKKAQERKAEEAAAEAEAKRIEGITAVNNDASLAILKNFPTKGIDRPRAGKGGVVAMLEKGGETDSKGIDTQAYHDKWVADNSANQRLKDLAELNYYKTYWDKALEAKNPEAYKQAMAAKGTGTINDFLKRADDLYGSGAYSEKLTTEEMEKMNPGYFKRTNELRKKLFLEGKVPGSGKVAGDIEGKIPVEDTAWGLRNSWNVFPAVKQYKFGNKKGITYSEGEMSMTYNPDDKEQYKYEAKLVKDNTKRALGGILPPTSRKISGNQADYLAEGGETIQFANRNQVATDGSGNLSRLNSDTAMINGPKHSSPAEGVGMSGGVRIFSDSDKLKVPKDFSQIFKKL